MSARRPSMRSAPQWWLRMCVLVALVACEPPPASVAMPSSTSPLPSNDPLFVRDQYVVTDPNIVEFALSALPASVASIRVEVLGVDGPEEPVVFLVCELEDTCDVQYAPGRNSVLFAAPFATAGDVVEIAYTRR